MPGLGASTVTAFLAVSHLPALWEVQLGHSQGMESVLGAGRGSRPAPQEHFGFPSAIYQACSECVGTCTPEWELPAALRAALWCPSLLPALSPTTHPPKNQQRR